MVSVSRYAEVYQDHNKNLKDFEKKTAPRDFLGNILTRAHNHGLYPTAPAASTSALDRAIREYDEDEDTETEGEHGEHSD
ncbi:hypothetical protein DFH06DRAFT_1339972 [Mycena polygramma]|nr:hypothetical protein DFH06DRAFT_1339972 [Mycena polygramma]